MYIDRRKELTFRAWALPESEEFYSDLYQPLDQLIWTERKKLAWPKVNGGNFPVETKAKQLLSTVKECFKLSLWRNGQNFSIQMKVTH